MFKIVFCALLTIYILVLAQTVGTVSGGTRGNSNSNIGSGDGRGRTNREDADRGKPRSHDVVRLPCNRNNRIIDCIQLPPDYTGWAEGSRARPACAENDLLYGQTSDRSGSNRTDRERRTLADQS